MSLGAVGGYKGQYWERTYTDLPAHNQLNLTFNVWAIDSWDRGSGDHFEVYVDGVIQKAWSFQWSTDGFVAKCGSSGWGELPPVLAISTFIHSASSVTIRFINQLDQVSSDESLGIRDIKMNFVTVTTPSNTLCGRSSANVALPSMPCVGCDTSHQFMNVTSSGTCFECATTCETCNAGGTSDCTSCKTAKYLSSGACNDCSPSCVTCVNSANSCTACQPGLFMASNSNCYSDCTFPLSVSESGGITYCHSPCSGSDYAMWDGSCSSTCLSELNATTMSSYSVCTFPCSINPINV